MRVKMLPKKLQRQKRFRINITIGDKLTKIEKNRNRKSLRMQNNNLRSLSKSKSLKK
jgi:hypothetical protein